MSASRSASRSSVLLASAALVVGAAFVPATALAADPTTSPAASPAPAAFTNADLRAAITAAQAPTAAAAAAGWMAQGTAGDAGSPAAPLTAIYAVDRSRTDIAGLGPLIEAQHAGTYLTVAAVDGPGAHIRQALKAIRKPHATWIFEPDSSLDLRAGDGGSAIGSIAPATILWALIDPTQTTLTGTPTKTVAADGSTTYAFSDIDLARDGKTGTGTVTIDPSGVVTAATNATASETETVAYTYGPQHVDLPTKGQTVTLKQLSQGYVLAGLPRQVKLAATEIAHQATARANGHPVNDTVIRSYAKRLATGTDRHLGLRIFTTRPIPGGAQLTGTNPFSHAHVTYAITAAGTKAVARKA